MIRSMTGFGKAERELADKKLTVEIRSLNSRQLDISIKIPAIFRDKEILLRNEISTRLSRGKIDLGIYIDFTGTENVSHINTNAVKHYVEQLIKTGKELGINTGDNLEMMKIALRMPETLVSSSPEADEKEWELIYESFISAIEQVNRFRSQEGEAIRKDLENRMGVIEELLSAVDQFEKDRVYNIRKRLEQNLNEFLSNNSADRNRFEQEIIYYLEKIDITEEKVRLENHLKYFMETMEEEEPTGKKLGFITQEIGREINTLGSKANDHNIQKLVVGMKDELEKVKEQTLNIL